MTTTDASEDTLVDRLGAALLANDEAEIEAIEAEINRVEREARRAEALARAEDRLAAEAIAAAEQEAKEAERQARREAAERLAVVDRKLLKVSEQWAELAGEVLGLAVEAMNEDARPRVLQHLRVAVQTHVAEPWGRRLLSELGRPYHDGSASVVGGQ